MSVRGRRAVATGTLAMALAACSSFEPPRSSTPRITDDPTASRDTPLLLTEADVRAVAGFEDATSQDLTDVDAFENPDPRGPCGARATEPPATGRYGRAFAAPGFAVVQFLQPSSAESKASIDSMKADLRPGCGPYTTRTNEGLVQQVSDVTPVDLPKCDRCVAWTLKATVAGETMYGGLLAYETAASYGTVQVMGEAPVPAAALVELFRRATSHLPD